MNGANGAIEITGQWRNARGLARGVREVWLILDNCTPTRRQKPAPEDSPTLPKFHIFHQPHRIEISE